MMISPVRQKLITISFLVYSLTELTNSNHKISVKVYFYGTDTSVEMEDTVFAKIL